MSKEKQNTPTNTPTQKQFTNCELKQIEEMARDIFAPKVAIDGIDIAFAAVHGADKPDSHFMRIAQHLYNAGYRKQSEVAREIFEEIEKYFDSDGLSVFMLREEFFELKKKYTEK